jgi:hypothetical protein
MREIFISRYFIQVISINIVGLNFSNSSKTPFFSRISLLSRSNQNSIFLTKLVALETLYLSIIFLDTGLPAPTTSQTERAPPRNQGHPFY